MRVRRIQITFALLLAGLSGIAPHARAAGELTEPLTVCLLEHVSPETFVARMAEEIRAGLRELPQWADSRNPQPTHRALVEAIARLSENQKAEILKEIEASPVQGPNRRLLKLAASDAHEWVAYVHSMSFAGADSLQMFSTLEPAVHRMPVSVRDLILADIAAEYPVSRLYKLHKLQYGGYRILSAMTSALLRPAELFRARAAQRISPIQILNEYFALVRGSALKGSSFDPYSAETVLGVARELQAFLKEKKGWIFDKNPHVTLYGSFPNGFADLSSSDIDLSFNSKRLTGRQTELRERLLTIIKTSKGRVSTGANGDKLETFGTVNPIQIYVDLNVIELRIWDGTRFVPYSLGP